MLKFGVFEIEWRLEFKVLFLMDAKVFKIDGISVTTDSFFKGFLIGLSLLILKFFDEGFDIFFLILIFLFYFLELLVRLLDKELSLMFFLIELINMFLDHLFLFLDDFLLYDIELLLNLGDLLLIFFHRLLELLEIAKFPEILFEFQAFDDFNVVNLLFVSFYLTWGSFKVDLCLFTIRFWCLMGRAFITGGLEHLYVNSWIVLLNIFILGYLYML